MRNFKSLLPYKVIHREGSRVSRLLVVVYVFQTPTLIYQNSVHTPVGFTAMQHWYRFPPLNNTGTYQLLTPNAKGHGDLAEDIYSTHPLGGLQHPEDSDCTANSSRFEQPL